MYQVDPLLFALLVLIPIHLWPEGVRGCLTLDLRGENCGEHGPGTSSLCKGNSNPPLAFSAAIPLPRDESSVQPSICSRIPVSRQLPAHPALPHGCFGTLRPQPGTRRERLQRSAEAKTPKLSHFLQFPALDPSPRAPSPYPGSPQRCHLGSAAPAVAPRGEWGGKCRVREALLLLISSVRAGSEPR